MHDGLELYPVETVLRKIPKTVNIFCFAVWNCFLIFFYLLFFIPCYNKKLIMLIEEINTLFELRNYIFANLHQNLLNH